MNFILQPWQLLVVILANWVNRQQQQVIEYLRTENLILREKAGKKRILLNDDQRRRLAVKGKALGHKLLKEFATLVTPDTILRWHRELVVRKLDVLSQRNAVGRPRISQEIVDLTLKLARENPTWGCDRIQGALANLGHTVSDTTVSKLLKSHGVEPAPDRQRQTTWETFLKAHWDSLFAIDFTTTEVWTLRGLVTISVLVVMRLKTRHIEITGVTTNPDSAWVTQVARKLTDPKEGFLRNASHVLMDRDTKFSPLRKFLETSTATKATLLPPRSPNLNAHLERLMRSLHEECLDRMIFFGEKPLQHALAEFQTHYHSERNHQGLDNQLIDPDQEVGQSSGIIDCRERLGGLLRYYHRRAA